jgi:hypothetical protein
VPDHLNRVIMLRAPRGPTHVPSVCHHQKPSGNG